MDPKLHLAELKQKLLHAGNFADVITYFFDHMGENPEFMELGEAMLHPRLQNVVVNVAGSMFPHKKALVLADIRFVHLPEHQFVHGAFMMEEGLANVIYFEDVQTGLVTVAGAKETKFARFNDKTVRPEIKPSRN